MTVRELVTVAQTINPNELKVPKDQLNSSTFGEILQFVLGIAGAIAVIVILLASLKYVTSQGNPQDTAQAKNTIIYAVIGLVIAAAAFAIVKFVVDIV